MFDIETKRVLVWDSYCNEMKPKTEVMVRLVGNKGSVFFEEGPLFCETGQDIYQAVCQLKSRLIGNHCLLDDSQTNTTFI